LYWARSSSQNAAPPPKPLTAEEVKAMEAKAAGSSGSVWNKGGSTWEEKPINTWAHEWLKESLGEMAYELPAAGAVPAVPKGDELEGAALSVRVRVAAVDSVSGEATFVVSRGKQRVVFELALKLQLEMEVHADGNLKTILTGKLTLPEVSNDDLDEARLPSGCKFTCEQAGWKPFFEAAAKASWGGIKTNCTRLVESAKAKWGA